MLLHSKDLPLFFNPNGGTSFDLNDWRELINPSSVDEYLAEIGGLSAFQPIIDKIYSTPINQDLDWMYQFWWTRDEMAECVKLSDLPGEYIQTTTILGEEFFFTGIPNVFYCAIYGGGHCSP
jgi:hypothetical protein